MNVSRDPMQIYRDLVLVKQQQMLNSLDLVYDRHVTKIRNQQNEIKKQIKLLFYKEMDRIDHQLNQHVHNCKSNSNKKGAFHPPKNKVKTIKMDIFDLVSTTDTVDSEDFPILHDAQRQISTTNHTENNDTKLSSIPPLPPLSYLLKPNPCLIEDPPKCASINIELASILMTLVAANHKLNSNAAETIPPLIPPLPDLSTLIIKQNKNDNLITTKAEAEAETDTKCNIIPTITLNDRCAMDLSSLPMIETCKSPDSDLESSALEAHTININESLYANIGLDDIPLMKRVKMRQESVMIHKTSDGTKWKCAVCRKWIIYASDTQIVKHLVEHQKERKLKCLYCDKIFKRKSDVKRHQRTHTGEKPHKCKICGKGFGTKYCLKTHVRTHTGEMPYICDKCGKAFRQNSHLTVHWRTHTGDKPYRCKICHKRFGQHSTLAVHYRIHNGDKPFVCQCCKRPFTQRHSLQRHIKNVHKEYANTYGVDHIDNLHSLQKLKKKKLQNNIAKTDKLMKQLFGKVI